MKNEGSREEIRLASDTEIYRQAITFVRETDGVGAIKTKQLMGLMEYSRSWDELRAFVVHQKDRDWKGRGEYPRFFTALLQAIDTLRRDVKTNPAFVPPNLTNAESKRFTDLYAGIFAREFIQHLAAEMLYNRRNERD